MSIVRLLVVLVVAVSMLGAAGVAFAQEYVPGELIVTYKKKANPAKVRADYGLTTISPFGTRSELVKVPDGVDVEELADELNKDKRVRSASPNGIIRAVDPPGGGGRSGDACCRGGVAGSGQPVS